MEIHNEIANMLGDTAPSETRVCLWGLEFKRGCTSIEDDLLSEYSKIATTRNAAPNLLHAKFLS